MADAIGRAAPRGGIVARGAVFALPEGARAASQPGVVQPIPGGPPEFLGLALEAGRFVLVWAFDPVPAAWVSFDGTGGPVVLGGAESLAVAPPGAPVVALPGLVASAPGPRPEAPPASAPPRAVGFPAGRAPFAARREARSGDLALRCGRGALAVPLAVLDGVRPMPAEISPVPGAPACVLGYAVTVDGPVLLLEPRWCFGESAAAAPPPDLVGVFRQAGRRMGVPCARVEPGTGGAELAPRLSGDPEGRRALDLAPVARDAPPRPVEAHRPLLLCRSAGMTFAVAAEDVEAVLRPQRPAPAPAAAGNPVRGACAHRGDVLPVFDAADRLGPGPGGTAGEAPLLRLALPSPVALAVSQVLGLRSVPADALALVAGDPLVAAFAVLDGRPVPVCRAAAFAGIPA